MTAAARHTVGIARIAAPAIAFGLLAMLLYLYFQRGLVPGDAFTYLAAGERLNAGHQLYALGPGDRPVDLNPPYWTVPFLSPPSMAVAWRPLAAIPSSAGAYLWWIGAILCIVTVTLAMMRRRPATTAAVMVVLAVPLTYEIGVGNVNAYLLAGAVGTWILGRSGRFMAAGPLAAAMVAVKLTPLPLGAWVVGAGRRRGLFGVVGGLAVCALISLAGAGFAAHQEYLGVIRSTATAGLSPASPGGIARALGLPDPIPALIPTLILGAATLLALVLPGRGRPTAGYVAAILGWTFGTPAFNVNTPVLLLALLAPLAWPWNDQNELVAGKGAVGVSPSPEAAHRDDVLRVDLEPLDHGS